MKTIHSQIINKNFIFKSDGGIRFEDKVKYSVKELTLMNKSGLDLDEIQAIHLLKNIIGGRVRKIGGSLRVGDNPLLSLPNRMRNAVQRANEYFNAGFVMPMSVHKAAKESSIDKDELQREVSTFAAWVKIQKK